MRVMLCWSGERSLRVARALAEWMPDVIQAVLPWISEEIEKGAKWEGALDDALSTARVGVLCLTPENLSSTWLHFEAGALARSAATARCTFLVGVKHEDVRQPLAQFQHTLVTEEDVLRLMKTINSAVGEAKENMLSEEQLTRAFTRVWPDLQRKLEAIAAEVQAAEKPPRSDSEILVEVLDTVRQLAKQMEADSLRVEGARNLERAVSRMIRSQKLRAKSQIFNLPHQHPDTIGLGSVLQEIGKYSNPQPPEEPK